jgi:hypothetical protein
MCNFNILWTKAAAATGPGTRRAAVENHGFAAQGRVLTDEYPLA